MDNLKRKFASKRRRKRKPPANRHLLAKKAKDYDENEARSETLASAQNNAQTVNNDHPATSADSDGPAAGSSSYKISTSLSSDPGLFETTGNIDSGPESGYRLVDISLLRNAISMASLCKRCRIGTIVLHENPKEKMGLANSWELCCDVCNCKVKLCTSQKAERAYEINRRMVLAMSSIGKGYQALTSMCSDLNIPKPMKADTYRDTLDTIKEATVSEATESMKRAADLEHEVAGVPKNDTLNTRAMFDGTWRKRGHSSLQGGITAISTVTGKCVDYEPLNKVCKGCDMVAKFDKDSEQYHQWEANHSCKINYTGSAPSMEPTGVERIFNRSVVNNNLRYTGYIGDGDCKSFSSIKEKKPYGDIAIEKFECVGHVQKRMGTALRNLKKASAKQKLSDGKTMGGRGRLTDKVIDKLQVYYGLAIRRHKHDLLGMKKEIQAGLYHSASTDDKPQHEFCPTGLDSWCKWQKREAERNELYSSLKKKSAAAKKKIVDKELPAFKHKDALPPAIVEAVKPTYKRLSDDNLLNRCLEGYTQNRCESLNQMIWIRCPKQTSSGRELLDFAFADAVCTFNDGAGAHVRVLKKLCVSAGYHTLRGLQLKDSARIRTSVRRASVIEKKKRQANRQGRKTGEEEAIQSEGTVYGPGIAD